MAKSHNFIRAICENCGKEFKKNSKKRRTISGAKGYGFRPINSKTCSRKCSREYGKNKNLERQNAKNIGKRKNG